MNYSRNFLFIFLLLSPFLMAHKIYAQTFVYCSEGSPSAFNPQITSDGTSHNATAYTIYNRLVEFAENSTQLVPSLAESWEIGPQGKTYTFKLRKDVTFHQTAYFTPTRKMNADDVLFSFNRQRLEDHPYHTVNGGRYDYFDSMGMGELIDKIEKLDDHTVRFTLKKAEAPFLANLAMSFASILSKEYADTLAKKSQKGKIDNYPVGTGPFVFKKYIKDNLIRYTRNDQYFLPAAKIKNLVFAITPDSSVRYQKLKAGECHLVIEPAPQDLEEMKKNPELKVMGDSGLNVGYLAYNTQKAPLNRADVRKAIDMALNKKAYVEAIFLNHATVAKGPLPPTIWGYDSSLPEHVYNPKKAKELLKKAGVKEGTSLELWSMAVSRPYNPNGKKLGEMMQADLAKIGLKIKIVSYDWPTYLAKARKGEHQLIQLGWTGDNGDPDNFLAVLLGCSGVEGGSNVARWCFQDFEKLINQAKTLTDQAQREALYIKAQKVFAQEMPFSPVATAKVFRAMRKNVQGYKIHPTGSDMFYSVSLD